MHTYSNGVQNVTYSVHHFTCFMCSKHAGDLLYTTYGRKTIWLLFLVMEYDGFRQEKYGKIPITSHCTMPNYGFQLRDLDEKCPNKYCEAQSDKYCISDIHFS